MVVQGRHRLAMEDGVVGQVPVGGNCTAASRLQVQPRGHRRAGHGVHRGDQPPGSSRGPVALAGVGKLHPASVGRSSRRPSKVIPEVMHSGDASAGPATPIFDEMPVPALTDLPLSDPRAADARPDARQRQLAMLLRAVAVAVAAVGVPHAVLGVLFGDPRAIGLGAMAIAYSVWLLREVERLDTGDRSPVIARIADVSLVLVGIAAVLQPSIAAAMAIAALLPPVLTLPFLEGHQNSAGAHARRVRRDRLGPRR